jgi:hypothetical protein
VDAEPVAEPAAEAPVVEVAPVTEAPAKPARRRKTMKAKSDPEAPRPKRAGTRARKSVRVKTEAADSD